tara:strand:+ start:3438 stop:3599 length:162 start_codon:yes stop_codon:yes gene_type:complete
MVDDKLPSYLNDSEFEGIMEHTNEHFKRTINIQNEKFYYNPHIRGVFCLWDDG